jgi:D-apionolactonase
MSQNSLSSPMLLHGSNEPLPEQIALRAGPLTMTFEHGDLRWIKLGEREVVRRIYGALRDQRWTTIPMQISNLLVDIDRDAFAISYTAHHRQGSIDFSWQATITGDSSGTLRFAMDGQAHSDFLRNRIGLCVLYPMEECVGVAARLEHVDGTREVASFPTAIAPQYVVDGVTQPCQPFAELRALSHQISANVWARLEVSGDIFELEDQRNWIDASFKLYSTPLRLPLPVAVSAGSSVQQEATLTLAYETAEQPAISAPTATSAAEPVLLKLDKNLVVGTLPALGLGIASHGQDLTSRELERIRALHLSHLRVELHLSQADYHHLLLRACNEARALDLPLEIALFVGEQAEQELDGLTHLLGTLQPPVARWLIFDKQGQYRPGLVDLARKLLSDTQQNTPFGSGTDRDFVALNRQPPPPGELDLFCYSANPQVHASDTSSLMETPPALAETVRSARRFAGELPLVVTPITLRRRVAIAQEQPTASLPPDVDTRQLAQCSASWTLACIKYLAESGAAAATFFETSGWRGVMEQETGSALPAAFPSLPGMLFPVYEVFAALGRQRSAKVYQCTSSASLRVVGLALTQNAHTQLFLANLWRNQEHVRIEGLHTSQMERRLEPFGIVSLEV